MIDFSLKGYEITSQIHDGMRSSVFRGKRASDGAPVVIKTHPRHYLAAAGPNRLREEFEMGSKVSGDRVAAYFALVDAGEAAAIIEEDAGGESLTAQMKSGKLPLKTVLSIAADVAEGLEQIHAARVIHKDVNPSNIIYDLASGRAKIIDFSISTELLSENANLQHLDIPEGTWPYISPEQTGRVNRAVDYRTDFYSLGVTLYEMLTGRLPFEGRDLLELVHDHIARRPPPPHEAAPDLPLVTSEIVMKLMAKNAADRYQSALGVKLDLQACLNGIVPGDKGKIEIEPFPIAGEDVSDRFQTPPRLYGRQGEIRDVLDAFERVCDGGVELLLVAGGPGVGKSALVREVHKPVTEKRGYFLEGKFDQYQRNIPYSGWIQAFRELTGHLLMESPRRLSLWKTGIQKAVGNIGKVLTDVIPNLDLIIGPQPDAPELGGWEARNRFNYVFQQFVRAVSEKDRPLVIFLDDLQWMDSASLGLLNALLGDSDMSGFLIIGAFRDNEVDAGHPLMISAAQLKKERKTLKTLSLENLSLENVNHLISDTLRCDPDRGASLARLVYSKTRGNAFFTHQLLYSLYDKGLIAFDFNRRGWQWDMAAIEAVEITDNVVALMVERVHQLPEGVREVLKLAACIGSPFDLEMLEMITDAPGRTAREELRPALREGIVIPFMDRCKFIHDRVQQAVYSSMSEESRKKVHQRIGRLLLEGLDREERRKKIHDIVHHLDSGRDLLQNQEEKTRLAGLNLTAGRAAKAEAAYDAMSEYLAVGIALLPEDGWTSHYDLALRLHEEAAEAAFLTGDFERVEVYSGEVLRRAATLADKISVYEVKIQTHVARNNPLEAIELAMNILGRMGLVFPEKPTPEVIGQSLMEIVSRFANHEVEALIDLPEMTDPNTLSAFRVM
ncbi:MAG: serine/threonine-protein kinase PknK, partial [Desulfobacterales bacterium]|nr:serine/threonine-protein kinase PknK [Desulfobacterales bacterium]